MIRNLLRRPLGLLGLSFTRDCQEAMRDRTDQLREVIERTARDCCNAREDVQSLSHALNQANADLEDEGANSGAFRREAAALRTKLERLETTESAQLTRTIDTIDRLIRAFDEHGIAPPDCLGFPPGGFYRLRQLLAEAHRLAPYGTFQPPAYDYAVRVLGLEIAAMKLDPGTIQLRVRVK